MQDEKKMTEEIGGDEGRDDTQEVDKRDQKRKEKANEEKKWMVRKTEKNFNFREKIKSAIKE